MLLIETDTSKVGVKVRIRKSIKAQQLPKYKVLEPKTPKTEKKAKNIRSKHLLPKHNFEELKVLIELKSISLPKRSEILKQLVYEETELVRVISRGRYGELIKYIVRIAGMRYVVNIKEITISTYDPTPFVLSDGISKKHTLIRGGSDAD